MVLFGYGILQSLTFDIFYEHPNAKFVKAGYARVTSFVSWVNFRPRKRFVAITSYNEYINLMHLIIIK